MDITTLVGSFAGFCTTVDTGKSGDLSFKMFSILATGVGTWVVNGFLKQDIVIIVTNAVSFCCLSASFGSAQRERTIRLSTAQLSGSAGGRSC